MLNCAWQCKRKALNLSWLSWDFSGHSADGAPIQGARLLEETVKLHKFHWALQMTTQLSQCPPFLFHPPFLALPPPGQETLCLSLVHLLIHCSANVNTNDWKSKIWCQEARNVSSIGPQVPRPFHWAPGPFHSKRGVWKALDQGQYRLFFHLQHSAHNSSIQSDRNLWSSCWNKFFLRMAKAKEFQLRIQRGKHYLLSSCIS